MHWDHSVYVEKPRPICVCCDEDASGVYVRSGASIPICVACYLTVRDRDPWWLRALRWLVR